MDIVILNAISRTAVYSQIRFNISAKGVSDEAIIPPDRVSNTCFEYLFACH